MPDPISTLAFATGAAFLSKFAGPASEALGKVALERAQQLGAKATALLSQVGREPQPVEPKLLLPLVQAASLETDETLAEKWAALLANASDPTHRIAVQPGFAEVLRQLTPIDARVAELLYAQTAYNFEQIRHAPKPIPTTGLAESLGLSLKEFAISIDSLLRLRLCDTPSANSYTYGKGELPPASFWQISPTIFGLEFIQAITPPSSTRTTSVVKNIYSDRSAEAYDTILVDWKDSTQQRIEADVFIGLPQEEIDIFTIERIQNATGDFMEAMGFQLKTQDEPIYGSFFQKLKYLLNNEVKQETAELYAKGKVALETQFIDLPSAEATSKLASAAASLITAIEGVSDAAIRCGSILLVKVTKDGVPKIITETISPELAILLNKNPALLQNPSIVFDLISGMRALEQKTEESGSAELAE